MIRPFSNMQSTTSKLALSNEWGPCPPDGYRYVDPESGFVAHAWTYVDWVNVEAAHLRANNREVPLDLGARMQDQLCKTLPPGWCLYDDDKRVRPSMSLTFSDVAQGLKTFARWIAGGAQSVPQAEADRRALVCSRCYLNVNVQGCSGCAAALQEVVRDKHSKYDAALHTCAVCKCFLKAKIHFPIDTLTKEDDSRQAIYPDFCWLKRGGENYHG